MITRRITKVLRGMRFLHVVVLVFILGYLAAAPPWAQADIPRYINYQGKLTDANDNPITDDLSITVRIYDAVTEGNLKWTETQTVTVSRGVFSILLGNTTALDDLDFNEAYWYSVEVESDGEMTPRQRLTAVGYAINADKLDGYDATDFLQAASDGELTLTGGANEDVEINPTGTGDVIIVIDTTSGDFKITDGSTNWLLVDNTTGDVTISRNLTVTGTTTLADTLDMNDNIDLDYSGTSAALDVDQASTGVAAQFTGGEVIIGEGTANANALAAGELYVQGDLEVDGTIYGTLSGTGTTFSSLTISDSDSTPTITFNDGSATDALTYDSTAEYPLSFSDKMSVTDMELRGGSPAAISFGTGDNKISLIYDPATDEIRFSRGTFAQDFRNLVKNGSFEAFSAFEQFHAYDPNYATSSQYTDYNWDTSFGYQGGWDQFAPDDWDFVSGKVFQHAPLSFETGFDAANIVADTYKQDFVEGISAVRLEHDGTDIGKITQTISGLKPSTVYSVGAKIRVEGVIVSGEETTTPNGSAKVDIEGEDGTESNPSDSNLNAYTTLSSAINDSVKSIPVASITGFPTFGTILLGTEKIRYEGLDDTAGANKFLKCTRASNSTTAASHSSGDTVIVAPFVALTTSTHTNYKKFEGQFATTPSAGDITIVLSAESGVAYFDTVQVVSGGTVPEYTPNTLVDTGDQTVYGSLRVGRSSDEQGGILSVDKFVRTRGIELFTDDPGLTGTTGGGGSTMENSGIFPPGSGWNDLSSSEPSIMLYVSGTYDPVSASPWRDYKVRIDGTVSGTNSTTYSWYYMDNSTGWTYQTGGENISIPTSDYEFIDDTIDGSTTGTAGVKIKFSGSPGKAGDTWWFNASNETYYQDDFSYQETFTYTPGKTRIYVDPEPSSPYFNQLVFEDGITKVSLSDLAGTVDTSAYIESPYATGGNSYNMWINVSGSYAGSTTTFEVKITDDNPSYPSSSSPDKFKWYPDNGDWSSEMDITGGQQVLGSTGIYVQFNENYYTGYWNAGTLYDAWTFTAYGSTSGSANVTSLEGQSGAIDLQSSDSSINISTGTNSINLTTAGGGGSFSAGDTLTGLVQSTASGINYFTGGGNVGIGTATPTRLLDVNGALITTSLEVRGASPATITFGSGSDARDLQIDPSTGEFEFSGGKLKQAFQNLVRNPSFETNSPMGWRGLMLNYNYTISPSVAKFGDKSLILIDDDASANEGIRLPISDTDPDWARLKGKTITLSLWAKADSAITTSVGFDSTGSETDVNTDTEIVPEQDSDIDLTTNPTTWQNFTVSYLVPSGATKLNLILYGAQYDSDGTNNPNVNVYFDGLTLVEGKLSLDYGPSPIFDTGSQVIYGSLAIGANYDPYASSSSNYYDAPRLVFGQPDSYFGGGYGGYSGGSGEIRFMKWGASPAAQFIFNRGVWLKDYYTSDYGSTLKVGGGGSTTPTYADDRGDVFIYGRLELDGKDISDAEYTSTPVLTVGTGTVNYAATGAGNAYVAGRLEVDGGIYGDGTNISGISGTISGLTSGAVPKAASATSLGDSVIFESSGNIGIGTTGPEGLLDVATGSGITLLVGADTNATTRTDTVTKLARIGLYHDTNAEKPMGLIYGINDGTVAQVNIGGGTSLMNAATQIGFWTAANDTTVTGSEKVRIDTTGLVGIGTTVPQSKLHVVGGIEMNYGNEIASYNAARDARGYIQLYNGTTGNMTLDTTWSGANIILQADGSGNVGIGTTAPTALLDVAGVIQAGSSNIDLVTAAGLLTHEAGGIELDIANIAIGDVLAGDGTGSMEIVESTGKSVGDVLTIQSGGAVDWETPGSGYTNAEAVAAVEAVTALEFDAATAISTYAGALTLAPVAGSNLNITTSGAGDVVVNTTQLVVDASTGNVGIGLASPTADLNVKGNPTTALTGTVTVSASSAAVEGSGTAFSTELAEGDAIKIGGETITIDTITDDDTLTLVANHTDGAAGVAAYKDSNLFLVQSGSGVSMLTLNKSGDLNVTGTINATVEGTSSDAQQLDGMDSTEFAILAGQSTGQTLSGGTGASENLTLDSTADSAKGYVLLAPSGGNVGIGTTVPGELLHIRKDQNANTMFKVENASSTSAAAAVLKVSSATSDGAFYAFPANRTTSSWNYADGVTFGAATTASGGLSITAQAAGSDIRFYSGGNSTPRMFIDSTGLVGIGTTVPTNLLHLIGSQPTAVGTTPATAATDSLAITGGTGGNTTIATTGVGGIGSDIAITGGTGGIASAAETASTGGKGGSFTLTGGAGGAATVSGTGTNTGGAGGDITIDPGTGGAASGGDTNTAGSYGNLLLATAGGKVGIGTTAPGRPLQVDDAVAAVIRLKDTAGSGTDSNAYVEFHNTNGRTGYMGRADISGFLLVNEDSTPIRFYTANNERMRIDATGNVGIGTTAPSAALSVGATEGFKVTSAGAVTALDTVNLGADDDISLLNIHDAGYITIYDDSDDESVQIGPVADGTTVLGVTGTINATALQEGGTGVPNTGDNLSVFAATTSAQLYGVLSDETGTASGTPLAVFNSAPTITDPVITNITPGADFTLTQNSVAPFTSVESGAVADTLYLNTGNVGIGTTVPGAKLQIKMEAAATTDTYNALYIKNDSDTNNSMLFYTSNVGGSSVGTGIYFRGGYPSPVVGAFVGARYDGGLQLVGNNNSTTGGIDLRTTPYGSGVWPVYAASDTTSVSRLKILPSGLVGIGTTGPTSLLHLLGSQPTAVASTPATAATDSLAITGGTGGNTTIATTGVGGIGSDLAITGGTGGIASAAETASTGGKGGSLTITGGAGGAATVSGTGTNTGGAGGDITIDPGTGGAASGGSTNTAGSYGNVLMATSGGKVGIGTTGPTAPLHLKGGAITGNTALFIAGTDTNAEALKLQADGDLYVGRYMYMNNPGILYVDSGEVMRLTTSEIKISKAVNMDGNYLNPGTDGGAVSAINMVIGTAPAAGTEESYTFGIDTNSMMKFYSEADGSGGIQNADIRFSTGASTPLSEVLRIDTTGNVGIGTTTPAALLDVQGVLQAGSSNIDLVTAAGLLTHEAGGIELDIANIAIGDVLAGDGAGSMEIVESTGKSVGDVLTIQTGGALDWETPSSGYTNAEAVAAVEAEATLEFDAATAISTAQGALDLAPVAGSNLNITTSGAGDVVVNTTQLVVDASTGNVGIGLASPTADLNVKGNPTTALTGTVTVSASSAAVEGSGTAFSTELAEGDAIKIGGETITIDTITDDDTLTLVANHTAGAAGVAAYKDSNLFLVQTGSGVSMLTLDKSGNLDVTGTINATVEGTSSDAQQLDGMDSTEFAILAGQSTGQTLSGGTGASENLTLQSTADTTKGYVLIPASNVGIGTTAPVGRLVVSDGTNTDFIVTTAGNVGFGTSTPLEDVHIEGKLRLWATHAADKIQLYGGGLEMIGTEGNTIIYTARQHKFIDDSSNVDMFIDTNGNVGIGTTGPIKLLHAYKSSAATNAVQQMARLTHVTSDTPAAGIGIGIEFEQETADDNKEIVASIDAVMSDVTATEEDADLSFKLMTAGGTAAEKMKLASTGDLTVSGDLTVTGASTNFQNAVKAVDGVGSGVDADLLDTLNSIEFAILAGQSGGQTLSGGTAASDDLTLDSTANASKGFVLLAPSGGNVGIGTTGPGYKLDILSNSTYESGESVALRLWHSGGAIGDDVSLLFDTAGSGDAKIRAVAPGGNDADLAFYTANTGSESISMYIDGDDGNVGIGTTAPARKLDINGSSIIYDQTATTGTSNLTIQAGAGQATGPTRLFDIFANDGTTARFHVTDTGNVGIGTTGPGVKLDVSGGDVAIQTAQKVVLDSNDTGDTSNTYFTHDATNNWISYYIDGSEAMRIKKR